MPKRTKPRGKACPSCGLDAWVRWGSRFRCVPCNRERTKLSARRRREDPAASLWARAKTRASQSGVAFSVTKDDIRAVYPADGLCPALGIPLRRGRNGVVLSSSPTLDRLNDAWGYEPGNIAVISMDANRAKGRLTAAKLELLAAWMRRQGLE